MPPWRAVAKPRSSFAIIMWFLAFGMTSGATLFLLFYGVLSSPDPRRPTFAAGHGRQPYDVRKIIEAFRVHHDDLKILCAHRGLRWNGTAENSRDSYFRASEGGIECIETDVRLSPDGYLPMLHDHGLGRVTDIGEVSGQAAYNPITGKGYNPKVETFNFSGPNGIGSLHLRDEQGRVRNEYVPTLPEMVQSIYDSGMNVVLQLDFKDERAIEPAYWALKGLTNRAGVPANEWCIYKLQSIWYQTPDVFESLPWVQDAFQNGVNLAFIPVYEPKYEDMFDTVDSARLFSQTNYTISIEVELRNEGGPLQKVLDYAQSSESPIGTTGVFFAPGDLTWPNTDSITFFDTGSISLPEDLHPNNSVYVFHENQSAVVLDAITGSDSSDGHDHRSDFNWLIEQNFDWIICDTPDEWHVRLAAQGMRNISHMIADGKKANDKPKMGWYK